MWARGIVVGRGVHGLDGAGRRSCVGGTGARQTRSASFRRKDAATERVRCLPADQERRGDRSEEHTSELQSHLNLVCRLLLEKKKTISYSNIVLRKIRLPSQ